MVTVFEKCLLLAPACYYSMKLAMDSKRRQAKNEFALTIYIRRVNIANIRSPCSPLPPCCWYHVFSFSTSSIIFLLRDHTFVYHVLGAEFEECIRKWWCLLPTANFLLLVVIILTDKENSLPIPLVGFASLGLSYFTELVKFYFKKKTGKTGFTGTNMCESLPPHEYQIPPQFYNIRSSNKWPPQMLRSFQGAPRESTEPIN